MLHSGFFLPQLIAETHLEMHVDWSRLAITGMVFVALAGVAIYLETRGTKPKKK